MAGLSADAGGHAWRGLPGSETDPEESRQEGERNLMVTLEPLDPAMPTCEHPRTFQLRNPLYCFHHFQWGFCLWQVKGV